jgi:hypothetical protein
MSVRDTLAQRAETHGGFPAKSAFIQQFKADMRSTKGWAGLADDQRESLDHIATKIGRILFGNADHHDNWHDVAGYATLIADRLEAA